MAELTLFMVLLGSKPPGRHIEQHDIFFGIGPSLEALTPAMQAYWPDSRIHIDAWREVSVVENWQIKVVPKGTAAQAEGKLFFINLGGYLENRFEEQHYILLTVKKDKAAASREAKETLFYKNNSFGARGVSHIDDKYGVDVDDLYDIEEMLTATQKEQYSISLIPAEGLEEDPMHLGYVKLDKNYVDEDE